MPLLGPTHLPRRVNECMHTVPPLHPLLWDILITARMSPHLILADIQKAFLQIGLKEEDRDAFRLLFNVNNQEQHLRFARVPFGAEGSPFMLAATANNHLDHQPITQESTIEALRENKYVDNLIPTGSDIEELKEFKEEAGSFLFINGSRTYSSETKSRIQVRYSVIIGTNVKIHSRFKPTHVFQKVLL